MIVLLRGSLLYFRGFTLNGGIHGGFVNYEETRRGRAAVCAVQGTVTGCGLAAMAEDIGS